MASSDEELVARSMGGDLDSFNQLVLRWERPIYALAYRVIGRDALAGFEATFGRGGEHELPLATIVQPRRRAACAEEGRHFRDHGFEGALQVEAGGNPLREHEEQLAQPLVEQDLALQPRQLRGGV